jgi:hypothetical protein
MTVNVFLSIPRSQVKMGKKSCTNSHPPHQMVLNGLLRALAALLPLTTEDVALFSLADDGAWACVNKLRIQFTT